MPDSYSAEFATYFCNSFLPKLISDGYFEENADIIFPATDDWHTAIVESNILKRYCYVPLHIPRYANMLYLACAEKINDLVQCRGATYTSAQTMLGQQEMGKIFPFLSVTLKSKKVRSHLNF